MLFWENDDVYLLRWIVFGMFRMVKYGIALTFPGFKGSTVFRNLCTLVLKDLLEFFADTLKLEMIDLLIQYPSIRWYKKN